MNVPELRVACKIAGIRGTAKLRKSQLESALAEHYARLRIQRWVRRIFSRGERCPVSLEPIKYPCYGYLSKHVFIYYNVNVLKEYLVESGNFTDPITRAEYSPKVLKELDSIDKYSRKTRSVDSEYVSVFACSKKHKMYMRKRQERNKILHRERIIDILCQDIVTYLVSFEGYFSMDTAAAYVRAYVHNIMYIYNLDKEHSIYLNQKALSVFFASIDQINIRKSHVFEYIVHEIGALESRLTQAQAQAQAQTQP